MKAKKPAKKSINYHDALKAGVPPPMLHEAPAFAPHHVGAFAAKTHLSALLEKVAKGETFVITKHGKPVAELKPVAAAAKKNELGWMKGKIWMAPDFDAPLDDFKDYL